MPRALLLCEYPTLNGGEYSLLSVLPGLAARGWSPVVAAPPNGPLSQALDAAGIPRVAWQLQEETGRRLPLPRVRELLHALLRQVQPDLLHANSLAMGRVAGPVARAAGVPSIAHLRDIIGLSSQAVADLTLNDCLLAVSHAVRHFHAAQGLPAELIQVLYNGVDTQRFAPRSKTGWLHGELQLDPGWLLVATIGQLIVRKGQDVLLKAAAEAARSRTNFACLLIGSRYSTKAEALDYERRLHELAGDAALQGRVFFLPHRDDLPQLFGEVDLLVHPARQEPLGRVLLEAAACGTPILATDVGGTAEIFPPEAGAAVLVPANDAPALAQELQVLLADASFRRNLGDAARERALAAFPAERAAIGLAEHYAAVLAASNGRKTSEAKQTRGS